MWELKDLTEVTFEWPWHCLVLLLLQTLYQMNQWITILPGMGHPLTTTCPRFSFFSPKLNVQTSCPATLLENMPTRATARFDPDQNALVPHQPTAILVGQLHDVLIVKQLDYAPGSSFHFCRCSLLPFSPWSTLAWLPSAVLRMGLLSQDLHGPPCSQRQGQFEALSWAIVSSGRGHHTSFFFKLLFSIFANTALLWC